MSRQSKSSAENTAGAGPGGWLAFAALDGGAKAESKTTALARASPGLFLCAKRDHSGWKEKELDAAFPLLMLANTLMSARWGTALLYLSCAAFLTLPKRKASFINYARVVCPSLFV